MIEIRQLMGKVDSVAINPSNLTGDAIVDNQSAFMKSIVSGGVATVDADGYILPGSESEFAIGIFVANAAANPLENYPASASGLIGVIIGGALVVTDQVSEGNISAGTLLYSGANGNFTSTAPSDTARAVGIARSKNSSADKRLLVHVY